MSDRYAPSAIAEAGDSRPFICPACASWALAADMFALTAVGLVELGQFLDCPGCFDGEPRWRCRYCGDLLASDGAVIYKHLRTHGEVA